MHMSLPTSERGYGAHYEFDVTWERDPANQASVRIDSTDVFEDVDPIEGESSWVCPVSNWDSPEAEIQSELRGFRPFANAVFS